ncbi:MAG TPA: GlsB/YeaQ/YmgE family stress response membrane protein [Opitutaceae bacterium]|jgi:uncharacterized membrane protein YeaQ/YmgE (transglycosylase-associated protein family)
MGIGALIILIVVGGVAGWIAGLITKGSGFGVAGNIIIGIGGAFLGGLCFSLLGIVAYGLLGRLIFAVLGSLLLLWLLSFVRR